MLSSLKQYGGIGLRLGNARLLCELGNSFVELVAEYHSAVAVSFEVDGGIESLCGLVQVLHARTNTQRFDALESANGQSNLATRYQSLFEVAGGVSVGISGLDDAERKMALRVAFFQLLERV